MKRVAIVGLGNFLAGDDAFGPYAVRQFVAHYEVGGEVEVLDLGAPGPELTGYLDGLDALIVVDTIDADAPAGTLRTYRKPELLAMAAPPRPTPHRPDVRAALMGLELKGTAPGEVLLVGAVPERVEAGVGLSRALRDALPDVICRLANELARLGHPAAKRAVARDPDIWWERPRRVANA